MSSKFRVSGATLIAALAMTAVDAPAQEADTDLLDWRADWELAAGLDMEIDSTGFVLPAQIAFVPDPGPAPDDPLYFVIELKGNIRVVTNDRTVLTFVEDFLPQPQGASFVPTGAAGICLDPNRGYVFATFAYLDDAQIWRNGMVRFTTRVGQFGLRPEKTDFFLKLFEDELSATSHQIGPCQVTDDLVYVTVGYGEDRSQSQNLRTTLGSIIRMTTDFEPVPENPFYLDDGAKTAIDYIWAYGFRNPFGLRLVGDRVFATENGGSVDRFNEIEKGENYLWDGTDWSIGARAAQLFSPSVGIVHLDYIPADSKLFPRNYNARFVAAASGVPNAVGPGARGTRSVLMWQYDLDARRMAGPPQHMLRYRGDGMQLPVSVALGPDALYFAALLPNRDGETPIYRITYDLSSSYPYRLGTNQTAQALINNFGCRSCHEITGQGGSAGPVLDSTLVGRLSERLNDAAYANRVAEIETLDGEPYVSYKAARADILSAAGEDRVRRWLPAYLREPKFDNPGVQMPTLGLSETQAEVIAEYLIRSTSVIAEEPGLVDRLRFAVAGQIPELRYRHLATSFVLGGAVALFFLLALYAAVLRHRRRQ